MFLVHRTGGGKYICAIHLHNNMLCQLQQRLCRGILSGGYALRCSFQGIIRGHDSLGQGILSGVAVRGCLTVFLSGYPFRGHDSYVIGNLQGNSLKLLKFAFVVKHNQNDNHYHLHLQQNIHQPLKLSFSSHSKAHTRRCYPLPYTTLPWPLSTPLMALYLSLSTCPQNRLISHPIEVPY